MAETVPANKELLAETVSANNLFLFFKTLNNVAKTEDKNILMYQNR